MKTAVIIDTGPLVAYLSARDAHHDWVYEQLAQIVSPVLTCEAVLTEVCFLIGRNGGNASDILDMLNAGWLSIPFVLMNESASISNLMKKYADVPMSLADACLLRMTELMPRSFLMTLDTDFLVYRRHGNKPIRLIMPDG